MSSIRFCCPPPQQSHNQVTSKGGEGGRGFREQHAAAFIKQHAQQEVKSNMFKKSDALILSAASISFLFSVSLWFGVFVSASKEAALFVGLWVPSILAAGIYFKTRLGAR